MHQTSLATGLRPDSPESSSAPSPLAVAREAVRMKKGRERQKGEGGKEGAVEKERGKLCTHKSFQKLAPMHDTRER